MGGGAVADRDGDRETIAGHQATRGRRNRGLHQIARFRQRKQHAQRRSLMEMGQPGRAVAARKNDIDAPANAAADGHGDVSGRRAGRKHRRGQ